MASLQTPLHSCNPNTSTKWPGITRYAIYLPIFSALLGIAQLVLGTLLLSNLNNSNRTSLECRDMREDNTAVGTFAPPLNVWTLPGPNGEWIPPSFSLAPTRLFFYRTVYVLFSLLVVCCSAVVVVGHFRGKKAGSGLAVCFGAGVDGCLGGSFVVWRLSWG
jgi:hypothetical protein